ncbi:MAG: class I mannose-6-phosphate isomerase [Bacteroidetes bacterium]|nr:class I mannose-6-phosphate isomerase [Bacteroidota bacterium]
MLYPLKFNPIFKEKVWGGNKIKRVLGQDYGNLENCGELWAISGVEGDQSIVENGFLKGNELNDLVEIYMGDLVGETVFEKFGNDFPLLIKFIDANEALSIQVHPNDELALKRHDGFGKNEMWYIIQAEKDAELISGFKNEMDQESYLKALNENRIKEVLNFEKANQGDVFDIPAGRVHAIGSGILLAEIQQTSDITYRIYDWDRKDDKGNTRELHTDLALQAIDFEKINNYKTIYNAEENQISPIISNQYFTTNIIKFDQPILKETLEFDSFIIYICNKGSFEVKSSEGSVTISTGETVLIPAEMKNFELIPKGKTEVLEVYIS